MAEAAKGYFKSAVRSLVLDREEIDAYCKHRDQDERNDLDPDAAARKEPERHHRDQHCPDGMWRWWDQKVLLAAITL